VLKLERETKERGERNDFVAENGEEGGTKAPMFKRARASACVTDSPHMYASPLDGRSMPTGIVARLILWW
jgi:hypothetical protein